MLPVFSSDVQATYDLLNDIVANETDPARRYGAYAALTRLCVLWAPGFQDNPTNKTNVDIVVNDLLKLLIFDVKLFKL